MGGHPHPGPVPEMDLTPPAPRYCEAPCAQECAPACMEWCCFPAIQPPPPAPAMPVPAPLPYGPNSYNGIPGLPQPMPPAVSMTDPMGQVQPQMPMMGGMKKHNVAKQQSKSKKNKKDAKYEVKSKKDQSKEKNEELVKNWD